MRITRITTNLTEQLEREPTRTELAEALGMDEHDLSVFQTHATPRQLISFDEVTENGHGEENLTLSERLSDPEAVHPDKAVVSEEDRHTMQHCLRTLPKAQVTVIVLHYLQDIPLREIARMLAVTPSRISQLHHQALSRLRTAWERRQDA